MTHEMKQVACCHHWIPSQGFIFSLQLLVFHAGLANSDSSTFPHHRAWLSERAAPVNSQLRILQSEIH